MTDGNPFLPTSFVPPVSLIQICGNARPFIPVDVASSQAQPLHPVLPPIRSATLDRQYMDPTLKGARAKER